MRKICTLLSLLMISIVMYAVPAKPGLWKTIKLSDGTEVRAQLIGDEYGHFWQAADGQAYLKESGTDYYSLVSLETIKAKAKTRRQAANARRMLRSPRKVLNSRRTSSTEKKALILLVNFKDTKFNSAHDNDLYQKITNKEGFNEGDFKGSMSDYFKAQSLGQFVLDFDVVGPLTVSNNYKYYGENDSRGNDMRPAEMVIEAVKKAKEQVTDWAQYDWDGDGEVDQVYVVYAGYGEADYDGDENVIWPHEYDLYSANYYGDGTGPVTVATGLTVNTYACGSELNGYGKICGIGTMCHEFSHCLGYPDFYDTDYSGGQGMGYWDLMDSGSYNDDGYLPAGFTSYERWTAGWITPTVLEEENVTIENMKALQETGESYVIYNKGHRDEFFLLENRQFIGWDASLPGEGLLILHCDYDKNVWAQNEPNDDPSHQRMTWIPADNKYQYTTYQGSKYYSFDGMVNDPFPYGSVNSFSKNTTPAAKFYNENTDGTYYMDSSVEDITQNSDGTISFKFVAGSTTPPDDPDDPEIPTGDYLFYESFDKCDGTGGNDGKWNGQIANATLSTQYDNSGWSAENAYQAKKCAKFGTGKKKGKATTPAFEVNGIATLTFRAAAWDGDTEGTTLNLSASNGKISPTSVTLTKGAWGNYTATITATGNVKVTFAAKNDKNNRFFLDEVLVVDPNAIALEPIEEESTIDFGESLTDEESLENTVVDNVYYNLSEDDGYDNTEGCIVINTNTDMSGVTNGKPGSEDIKSHFAGLIIEVNGYGVIDLDCETSDANVLNVKIGDNNPMTITQSQRGTVQLDYNVTEPTYVYIYVTASGSSAPANRVASENSVKIYSLAVKPNTTGISATLRNELTNEKWYTLDGRLLQGKPMRKGVYIRNGEKVVIK